MPAKRRNAASKALTSQPRPAPPPKEDPWIPSDDSDPEDLLPRSEQMRIIEETGILSRIPHARPAKGPAKGVEPLVEFDDEQSEQPGLDPEDAAVQEDDTLPEWVDQACDVVLYVIPFCILFVGMDILVHQQYSQELTFQMSISRILNFVPGLVILIFLTLRYPSHPITILFLFLASAIGGSWMVWAVNKEGYMMVMRRCPSVGTLWVYAVVRMDLLPAVLSLVIVGGYCWQNGLKIVF